LEVVAYFQFVLIYEVFDVGAVFCFVASPEGVMGIEVSCQYGVVVDDFVPIFYFQDSSLLSEGVFLDFLVVDVDDSCSPSLVPSVYLVFSLSSFLLSSFIL
jgi:hypothetical protein